MKKLFVLTIIFAFFFAASCSFGEGVTDSFNTLNGGSITMTLPQSPAAQGLTSASIASEGSLENEAVSTFKIYVRNFDIKKEIVQEAKPGSTITIDELEPGTWSVSIRGLDSEGGMLFYGKSQDIIVTAGQTAAAAITLGKIEPEYLSYQLSGSSSSTDIRFAYIKYSCSQLHQEGEAFYECNSSSLSLINGFLNTPAPEFFEPGYTYSITGLFYNSSGQLLWKANYSQTVPKNGGAIYSSETFDEQENKLYTLDNLNGNYYIGEDLSSFISEYITEFTIDGLETAVPFDDVSVNAISNDYCGIVPVIFTYKDYSYIIAMNFYHPVNPPSLYMDNISIPVGVTRDMSPYLTISPSSPELWQIYGPETNGDSTEYDSYGFSKYGLHGKTDSDTWSTASLTKVSDSTYTELSETSITGKTASADSEMYEWTVNATGTYYGAYQNNGASQSFNVTCVAWTVDNTSLTPTLYSPFSVTLTNSAATSDELNAVATGLSYMLSDDVTVVNGGTATVSGNSIVINFASQDGWGLSDPKTINIIYNSKKLATFTVEYIQVIP
ncbi:MAG: hypothetical protein K6A42_06085 [Treponema sp.]|nr:hypothetical protein [Treponema sp.]